MSKYKDRLWTKSPLHGDDEFIIILINGKYTLKSSPKRGEFTIHNIPYGFYLYGYRGENQITVLSSSGQGGKTVIHVVSMAVDGGCDSLTKMVDWDYECTAINDMINNLYFR